MVANINVREMSLSPFFERMQRTLCSLPHNINVRGLSLSPFSRRKERLPNKCVNTIIMFGQRDLLLFGCIFLFVVACSKYFKKNNIIEGQTVRSSGVIDHCYDGSMTPDCPTCDSVKHRYNNMKPNRWRYNEDDFHQCRREKYGEENELSVHVSPVIYQMDENPELKITAKYHIVNDVGDTGVPRLDSDTRKVFQYLTDVSNVNKIDGLKTDSDEYKRFMANTCALRVESRKSSEPAVASKKGTCDFADANWISPEENEQCKSLYEPDYDNGEEFRKAQELFFSPNIPHGVEDYFSQPYTPERFPTLLLKNKDESRIAKIIKIPCKAVADTHEKDILPENLCFHPKEENRMNVPHCMAYTGLRNNFNNSPQELAETCKKNINDRMCARFYHEWLPYANIIHATVPDPFTPATSNVAPNSVQGVMPAAAVVQSSLIPGAIVPSASGATPPNAVPNSVQGAMPTTPVVQSSVIPGAMPPNAVTGAVSGGAMPTTSQVQSNVFPTIFTGPEQWTGLGTVF